MRIPSFLIKLHQRIKHTRVWRNKWKILSVFPFILALIIFATYSVYNHLAETAYQGFVIAWEEKGETLDIAAISPPPPPGEEDFCSHPAIVAESARPSEEFLQSVHRMSISGISSDYSSIRHNNGKGTYQMGIPSDIRDWLDPCDPKTSEKDAADRILTLLNPYQKRQDLIKEAAARPKAYYPPMMDARGEDLTNNNLDLFRIIASDISFLTDQNMCLHVTGQNAKTAANVHTMFALLRHAQQQNNLLGFILALQSFHLIEKPIWQGLQQRAWSDESLASLENQLKQFDFHQQCLDSIRGEMAYLAMICKITLNDPEYLDRQRKKVSAAWASAFGSSTTKPTWKERGQELWEKAKPKGWYLRQGTRQLQVFDSLLFYPQGERCTQLSVEQIHAFAAEKDPFHDPVIDSTGGDDTMEVYAKQITRALHAQAKLHNIRTAIALERYHLKHGSYPKYLEELVPTFLPEVLEDVITGKPLNYRIKPDGTPLIYSIGSNEKDDNGRPHRDKEKGDWAWMYSPPAGFTYDDYKKR